MNRFSLRPFVVRRPFARPHRRSQALPLNEGPAPLGMSQGWLAVLPAFLRSASLCRCLQIGAAAAATAAPAPFTAAAAAAAAPSMPPPPPPPLPLPPPAPQLASNSSEYSQPALGPTDRPQIESESQKPRSVSVSASAGDSIRID